ncbi:MAG: ABC transporter permease [Lachnospiraceae bacterium]|nr:ABC transporter permease [Lachnospiraceae bacterium]
MTKRHPPVFHSDSTISSGQKEFLAAELLHRRQVAISRSMLFVLLLALWELAARFGWIDRFIFSSPSGIAACLLRMAADKSLFLHTGITLAETLISFLLVIGIGLAAALLLWSSRTLSEVLEPYLVILNSLPKSALAPLLIVWLGNNTKTIITAAVSVALFGSILTLHNGFSQTDPDKIKLIYSLGGTKADVLKKVLLPSSIPLIISSMKVNIGLCLVGVIIGEFLSSRAGLGYLIIYGSQTFAMTTVVTSIVILCVLSAVLYQGIAWLEKKIK